MEFFNKQRVFYNLRRYIPDFDRALREMQKQEIIAVGVAPYTRIIPALFLKHYSIYCTNDSADIDLLRRYAKIYSLAEHNPKIAAKVRSTGYLLKNYVFKSFLNSRRHPYALLFYQAGKNIVDILDAEDLPWIGNRPETFKDVVLKGDFRELLKTLRLSHVPNLLLPRNEFLSKSFKEIWDYWGRRSFVCQRADFDVMGELGTFFIKNEDDWHKMRAILSIDTRYTKITISPFIDGYSVSILGCITHLGVLTSPLQLQFIDVPESLHGQTPTGVFLGHDWGFFPWGEETELKAKRIVEEIGAHLAGKGYLGIFGIDFMYDKKTKEIFPIECNPRWTGVLPVYSLMTMTNGVPPMEFFHILSHLKINAPFDFRGINEGFKKRSNVSHISLVPKGVYKMTLALNAGVYSYHKEENIIQYERPGAFLWDLQNDKEFLLIDSVPHFGSNVIQNVQRLFKLIFPQTIAESSSLIRKDIGELITKLSIKLRKDQPPQDEFKKSEEKTEDVLQE